MPAWVRIKETFTYRKHNWEQGTKLCFTAKNYFDFLAILFKIRKNTDGILGFVKYWKMFLYGWGKESTKICKSTHTRITDLAVFCVILTQKQQHKNNNINSLNLTNLNYVYEYFQ